MSHFNIPVFLIFFHREKGRRCGPDGFLDSNKYTHTFEVQGKVLDNKNGRRSEEDRSPTTGRRSKEGAAKKGDVVGLFANIERDKKDFDKQMKVIEVIYSYQCTAV